MEEISQEVPVSDLYSVRIAIKPTQKILEKINSKLKVISPL